MYKLSWPCFFIVASLFLATSCTQRNPDLCCATDAECAAIDFSSRAPCDLGVCVNNECNKTPGVCDDDGDCAGNPAAPFCVAGTCAACASSASCPITDPVCDATAHDCRTCIKDGECASLVCDLSAGTCVDPAGILYASPSGAATDPCTRNAPCSLAGAAQKVDTEHPYIALLPGNHISGALFENKVVTIAGNDATLEQVNPTASSVDIHGGTVTIRDLHIEEHLLDNPGGDGTAVIAVSGTTLKISNLTSHTTLLGAIFGAGSDDISLINSTLTGASIATEVNANVAIDRCSFDSGPFVMGSLSLTNSIIVADASSIAVSVFDADKTLSNSTIYNNTIIGGQITCNTFSAFFENNIILNSSISNSSGCVYNYNLTSSDIALNKDTNLIGDPKFVDATKHDFHLTADSPARDAGAPLLNTITHDFDGTPRPQGPHNDIGAFEYVAPPAP